MDVAVLMIAYGVRSSRSPGREGVDGEGKREVKGLHSTFAKAEAETVLPDKADHLILPPQRVDTSFPQPPSHRYVHLACERPMHCMTAV